MRAICTNSYKRKSRKGFSLSEVLISIGLMAFVGTAAIGGLVVVSDVRDKIDKQNKAEMIMYATEGYLRADLNCCTNPSDMDCSVYYGIAYSTSFKPSDPIYIDENPNFGPTFFSIDPTKGRYTNFITCNNIVSSKVTSKSNVTCTFPKVQYWNSSCGICVGINYVSTSSSAIWTNRKYVIAQMVMDGTGMYSLIGNDSLNVGDTYEIGKLDESIKWDETEKMFTFWIYIIDKNDNNKVIMKHKVEVCPDPLMPTTIP